MTAMFVFLLTTTILCHSINGNYIVSSSLTTWQQGEDYCLSTHQTHLASLHSSDDFDAISALCQGMWSCWLGLNRLNNNSVYEWSDGSDLDYGFTGSEPNKYILPWGTNEPDGTPDKQCIYFRYGDDRWSDTQCTDAAHLFICNNITISPITTTMDPTTATPTTLSPTFMPTTNIPTAVLSTNMDSDMEVDGIEIILTFQFIVNENDTNIILEILKQVTDNIINDTNISNDCVAPINYNVQNTTSISSTTVFDVTVFLCDGQSTNTLLVAIMNDNKLQTEMIHAINTNNKLTITIDESDMILSSTIIDIQTTNILTTLFKQNVTIFEKKSGDNDMELWLLIVLIFVSIICVCLFILCLWIGIKIKSDKKLHETVQMISTVQSGSDDNILHYDEQTQMAEINTVTKAHQTTKGNNIQTEKGNEDKTVIMFWLQNEVKLPEYYTEFVEHGYESLQFIKEIKDESELVDIGITKLEHRVLIINAIHTLSENTNYGNEGFNIISVDAETSKGSDIVNDDGLSQEEFEVVDTENVTKI
eukprot:276293_1